MDKDEEIAANVDLKWIARNFGRVLGVLLNPKKLFRLSRDERWGPHAHLAILIEGVVLIGLVIVLLQFSA